MISYYIAATCSMKKTMTINKEIFTNKKYHQEGLTDALTNFDMHETTCSHNLRESNVFLNGKNYGQVIYRKLAQKHGRPFSNIIEIGAGTGDLALNFIKEWNFRERENSKKKYSILDLSPVLISEQKKRLSKSPISINWKEFDISEIKEKGLRKKADIIISNEVIADLDIIVLNQRNVKKFLPKVNKEIANLILNYLEHDSEIFFPIGFLNMLQNLKAMSNKDTSIFISEYFSRAGGGGFYKLFGHTEFSLNLDLVCDLCRCFGFSVKCESLIDYMDMNLNVQPVEKGYLNFAQLFLNTKTSPSLPLEEKELKKILNIKHANNTNGVTSRASWVKVFSNYYTLILKNKHASSKINRLFIPKLVPDAVVIKNSNSDSILIRNYPLKFTFLEKKQKYIIKMIDGKRNLDFIATAFSIKFSCSKKESFLEIRKIILEMHKDFLEN